MWRCGNSAVSRLGAKVSRALGLHDLRSEFAWWSNYLGHRPPINDPEQQRNAFPTLLLPFLTKLVQHNNNSAKLLEIGSGPASLLAWGVQQNLFELTAIDPLAEQYERLLKQLGIRYPIRPITGYAERLLDLFPEKSFDLVYSSNALDHVMRPKECIDNICLVVRSGGIICLEGFCREGTNARWTGLHQHDLMPENGHLLYFTKDGTRTNLTKNLPVKCLLQNIAPFADRAIGTFGYESDELGTVSDWHYRDWYTIIFAVT